MITRKMVEDGIRAKLITFEVDPNMEEGTVCRIGDNWFYFGGLTAAEESPQEYLENVPMEDIISEVLETLESFRLEPETFGDEYDYYEHILRHAEVCVMKEYTICFEATGRITVEAESEDAAMEYFNSEAGQEAVGMILSQNDVDVTEVYVEE